MVADIPPRNPLAVLSGTSHTDTSERIHDGHQSMTECHEMWRRGISTLNTNFYAANFNERIHQPLLPTSEQRSRKWSSHCQEELRQRDSFHALMSRRATPHRASESNLNPAIPTHEAIAIRDEKTKAAYCHYFDKRRGV
ncbi:hypothetical protein P5673_025714 [Acropora cervicornis]|uniref:Uncharacterized protein n=1 Tax=Acropora cervicornis TaxID=6130 RepID=A0AAD9Q1H2_ACRCE|nr:hypothetical protein P5673_025714 [Acropora cervicornis]